MLKMPWDGLHNIHRCKENGAELVWELEEPHTGTRSQLFSRLLFQRSLQLCKLEGRRIGGKTGDQLVSRLVQEEV
jgi:hypothetical protein